MSLLETEGWLIVGVYQQTHSKLKIYQGLLVVEGSWGGLEMLLQCCRCTAAQNSVTLYAVVA